MNPDLTQVLLAVLVGCAGTFVVIYFWSSSVATISIDVGIRAERSLKMRGASASSARKAGFAAFGIVYLALLTGAPAVNGVIDAVWAILLG